MTYLLWLLDLTRHGASRYLNPKVKVSIERSLWFVSSIEYSMAVRGFIKIKKLPQYADLDSYLQLHGPVVGIYHGCN